MKKINFISPVPQSKKKEVRRWFILSSLLIGSTLLYIGASLSTHLYLYYILSSQLKQSSSDPITHAALMQKQKEKEQAYKTGTEQRAKIEQYHAAPKNPHALLHATMQHLGTTALQRCSVTPHTIEFSYNSGTIQHAQKQLEQLKTIPELSQAQLVSLQRHNNSITSLVRAERSKKKSRS